ncbi:variable large family protein, partial [Borreliella garinii]|uniref:variable large family protein n=1 Tax=Borreliella garinii TaxID=29519 RepID=UPI001AF0234E
MFASQNGQGGDADDAGKAADGDGSEVGNVVDANNGGIADDKSVKGIASGMKAIVEVAEKVDGVKFEPEKAVEAADDGNKDAGKLFASQGGQGAAADAGNAANGEGSEDVGNVVNAAGGSKADDASVKGIASGMKAIVEVAEKVEGVKFEPEKVVDAAGDGNKNAGKLFASQGNGGAAADAGNAADGDGSEVGNVVNAANGGIADGESVKGIAGGMKAIVEVAKKVEGVKFEPEAA